MTPRQRQGAILVLVGLALPIGALGPRRPWDPRAVSDPRLVAEEPSAQSSADTPAPSERAPDAVKDQTDERSRLILGSGIGKAQRRRRKKTKARGPADAAMTDDARAAYAMVRQFMRGMKGSLGSSLPYLRMCLEFTFCKH